MSKMEVVVTNNGNVISIMDTDSFMEVAKNNFGIGRGKSLSDYISRYNQLYPENKAEIKLVK